MIVLSKANWKKSVLLITINFLVFFACVGMVEAGFQFYVLLHPAHDVLFLEPDPAVGWKKVPHLLWRWSGAYWYAREFSIPIRTNGLGFGEREWGFSKAPGVIRTALIGDSYVEAVQVPLKKRASYLLEQKLNKELTAGRPRHYEVLNFGVSNYGIGQYLLVWEEYVRRFHPNYVFIFIAGFHMNRTVDGFEGGMFQSTEGKELWIRPTFRLEGESLVREPARDYDEFVRVQDKLIQEEFSGKRVRRRKPHLLIEQFVRELKEKFERRFHKSEEATREVAQTASAVKLEGAVPPEVDPETLEINLKIIEELGKQVRQTGATLVIADAIQYFRSSSKDLSRRLESLAKEKGLGYLPLSDYLNEASDRGISTQWRYDSHFNKAGNEVFAQAMYEWFLKETKRKELPAGSDGRLRA